MATPVIDDSDWETISSPSAPMPSASGAPSPSAADSDWETVSGPSLPFASSGSGAPPDKSQSPGFWSGVYDSTIGAAKGIANSINPIEDIKQGHYGDAAMKLLGGPGYGIGKGILGAQVNQAKKVPEYIKAGRYSEAMGHGLASVVPGVGPLAADLTDTAMGEPVMPPGQQVEAPRPPNPKYAIGQAVGALGAAAITNGAIKYGSRAADVVDRVDPTVALVKALKPTPSDSGFTDRLPETMANVKAAAPSDITGNESLLEATRAAIAKHGNLFEQWMNPAREMGSQASGNTIAQATSNAIPASMRLEDPISANAIIDKANSAYQGSAFTVDQLRTLLKEKNAELDSFYDKSTGKQIASVTSGSPLSVVKAQRDAIADTLYRTLDPENEGEGPRIIQKQTGDMIDILDAAQRRRNAIVGEQPVSTASALGKAIAGTLSLPGKLATGDIDEGIQNIRNAMSAPSDVLIRRAFKATGPPNPVRLPQPRPKGQLALPPAPITTPAPEDTSGPFEPIIPPGFGSVSMRQLPAASSGIGVSGTVVPDIIGRSSRGSSVPLLPPPEAGNPPVNVLPTGTMPGGAIGPGSSTVIHSVENPIPLEENAGRVARRNAKPPEVPSTGPSERVSRVQDARERLAQTLTGKSWDESSNPERNTIDGLINESYGFSATSPKSLSTKNRPSVANILGRSIVRNNQPQ